MTAGHERTGARDSGGNDNLLVLRVGDRLCGLPISHVDEIMRPLPWEPVPGVPPFVRGVSIVRGRPTPIVDLRALLGDDAQRCPTRLISLRVGDVRRVGLLADGVLGIRDRHELRLDDVPPLLRGEESDIVLELARLDSQLLTVLRAARLLPDDVWCSVAGGEAHHE